MPDRPPLDKYFLDDTDFVLLVDVKQVVASPLFAKHFRKPVEAWRDGLPARAWLKALGVDPLKDVERLALLTGKSCHDDGTSTGAPFILITGRFDPARMRRGLAQLAKAMPDRVVAHEGRGGAVYELKGLLPAGALFAAPLDPHTVLLAGHKHQVREALAKVGGKTRTKFTIPAVAAWLKKLKPGVAVQGFGAEQMVVNTTRSESVVNGQRVTKVNYQTLGDVGLRELHVRLTVKDEVQARVALTGKEGPKLKELAQQFRQVLPFLKTAVAGQAQADPKLAPLVKLVEGIKLETDATTLALEGRATAEMVRALLDAMQR
jgi:hypothetical protein